MFYLVRLESGAVTWHNGANLAQDAMYDAIRANGRWTVRDESTAPGEGTG